jgi:hypothetical protein
MRQHIFETFFFVLLLAAFFPFLWYFWKTTSLKSSVIHTSHWHWLALGALCAVVRIFNMIYEFMSDAFLKAIYQIGN